MRGQARVPGADAARAAEAAYGLRLARREKELRNSYRRVWIPYPTEVPAAGEAVPDE